MSINLLLLLFYKVLLHVFLKLLLLLFTLYRLEIKLKEVKYIFLGPRTDKKYMVELETKAMCFASINFPVHHTY